MKVTLALVVCVGVGGCSVIYNENNIGKPIDAPPVPDAAPDAAIPDAPPNPTMLAIAGVSPSQIFAGEGSGFSRPAVLAIHGSNFTSDATVAFDNPQLHVVGMQVAGDAGWIAVQLEIDAIAGSGSDGSDGSDGSGSDGSGAANCGSAFSGTPVAITVTESGGTPVTLTCALALQQPPALTGSATVTVAALASTTYSVIDLSGVTITPSGSNGPVVFKSYSSITLPMIDVQGAAASQSTGGAAGQGGCPGASNGSAGGCSTTYGAGNGALASGLSGGGGGGGGFTVMGDNGNTGANGGVQHGTLDLVASIGNQSAGGGGGAAGGVAAGGGGGGGGGIVIVEAEGSLNITGVDAAGGAGAAGSSVIGGAGGGGGGTGGVIILRSNASQVVASGALSVDPGGGGAAGSEGGGLGGKGSPGRVRVDSQPGGTMPTISTGASYYAGPVFAAATSQVVDAASATLTLYGQIGASAVVYHTDGTGSDTPITFQSTGTATASGVSLVPGYNKLCAMLDSAGATVDLANTCVEIIYLPH